MGTGADINVIAENLTELLQNSVNMTSVFYDIFINPTPMDVELTQIGSEGEVVVISVPNRAKDKIIATLGEGSPEGVVEAGAGKIYVDELTRDCYIKTTGTGSTGWQIILTEQGVYTYVDTYLHNSGYVDEEGLAQYLEKNKYTTEVEVSSILANTTQTQFITTLPSSGQIVLEDNCAYRMNKTGNTEFILPQITDYTKTHKIFLQILNQSGTTNLGCSVFFDGVGNSFADYGMYDVRYEFDLNSHQWVCGVSLKQIAINWSLAALKGYVTSLQIDMTSAENEIADIQTVIPSAATASNQLADKEFVNSSISTNTANFIGTFNSVAELEAYSGTLTNNDYAFVISTDATGNTVYNRYKYSASTDQWEFEYTLNNSSFTADQWAAINSSITSSLTTQITTNKNNIAGLRVEVSALESGTAVQATYDSDTETIIFATT